MGSDSDFISLALGANFVDEAIGAFAAKNPDVFSDVRYHDCDVWVMEQGDDSLCRSVQIAAFRDQEGGSLYFIPQATSFAGDTVYAVSPEICAAKTTTLPLSQLCSYVSLGQRDAAVSAIYEKLCEAWGAALAFSVSDILGLDTTVQASFRPAEP